jgi:hypothetical protein
MTERKRKRELGAAFTVALCLGGCGSGAEHRAPPPPLLPQAMAAGLAQTSDAVAAALDGGDPCGALTIAQDLQRQTIGAINTGRVPGPLEEPLQNAVNDLAGRIQCVPPPSGGGDGNGHGQGKQKQGESD